MRATENPELHRKYMWGPWRRIRQASLGYESKRKTVWVQPTELNWGRGQKGAENDEERDLGSVLHERTVL